MKADWSAGVVSQGSTRPLCISLLVYLLGTSHPAGFGCFGHVARASSGGRNVDFWGLPFELFPVGRLLGRQLSAWGVCRGPRPPTDVLLGLQTCRFRGRETCLFRSRSV